MYEKLHLIQYTVYELPEGLNKYPYVNECSGVDSGKTVEPIETKRTTLAYYDECNDRYYSPELQQVFNARQVTLLVG